MEPAPAKAPPEGAPADVVAAWPAMCPPVRARYAADAVGSRARGLSRRWAKWEVRRRLRRAAGSGPDAPFPPDARILAIRPDHLGDVLLTTPALRLIKEALPTAHVTVLAGPWGADVPAHCPAVDRVLECPFPGFRRADRAGGLAAKVRRALRSHRLLLDTAAFLVEDRYHLAVNFRPDFWWGAALAALAGIPYRVGYLSSGTEDFLTSGLVGARPIVGAAAPRQSSRHAAELGLALAREALALLGRSPPAGFDTRIQYEPTPDERSEANRLWRAYQLDQARGVVAIHPSPGEPVKRWLPERFAWLADHLAGRFGARIVVTGGPSDVAEAALVARACRKTPVVLAGHTSFGVLAALFERCRFVAGTDNGALHLASARGVPSMRLFGPTDAGIWGARPAPAPPAGPTPAIGTSCEVLSASATSISISSTLPCSPCHRLDVPPWEQSGGEGPAYPCLREVTVERVIAAAEALWAASDRPC